MIGLVTAMVIVFLGYLIKYKRWSWLIAGYNTASPKDKALYDEIALCTGMGNFLFLLAAITIIPAIGEFVGKPWIIGLGWAMFTVAVFAFLIYANTGNRFKKPE